MKRIVTVTLAAFISVPAANAEETSDAMYLARLGVQATAMMASEFERCGVDSSRMINTMIDWAANSCHASDQQISELRSVYDQKLRDVVKELKSKSDQCRWNPGQTQGELDKSFASVEGFTKAQCPK